MAIVAQEDHLTAYGRVPYHRIIAKNFVGGIAWGVGSVLGATVIISFIAWILGYFNFLPFIGGMVSEFSREVNNYSRY